MGKTLTKSFKVDEEQYELWEEFLHESIEVESFSHLVRLALSAYVSEETTPSSAAPRKAEERINAEILQEIRDLRLKYEALQSELEHQNEEYVAALKKRLNMSLIDIVPERPNDSREGALERISDWAISETELSSKLDESREETRRLLSDLASTYGAVERYRPDGSDENYWYIQL